MVNQIGISDQESIQMVLHFLVSVVILDGTVWNGINLLSSRGHIFRNHFNCGLCSVTYNDV